jgi:repressor LexA|tara:strand:+ start:537 stop:743 length:207 start_codon:yes stop_codon:yes gene_type:complete
MTPKQKIIYDAIKDFQKKNGYSPTYQELANATSMKSKASVHKIVKQLKERNKIIHIDGKNRSIEILHG